MKTKMTVYVVKYLFSEGIQEREIFEDEQNDRLANDAEDNYFVAYKKGEDWFYTWEEAVTRAETMKAKKIALLEKKIKKIRNLQFTQPE